MNFRFGKVIVFFFSFLGKVYKPIILLLFVREEIVGIFTINIFFSNFSTVKNTESLNLIG